MIDVTASLNEFLDIAEFGYVESANVNPLIAADEWCYVFIGNLRPLYVGVTKYPSHRIGVGHRWRTHRRLADEVIARPFATRRASEAFEAVFIEAWGPHLTNIAPGAIHTIDTLNDSDTDEANQAVTEVNASLDEVGRRFMWDRLVTHHGWYSLTPRGEFRTWPIREAAA